MLSAKAPPTRPNKRTQAIDVTTRNFRNALPLPLVDPGPTFAKSDRIPARHVNRSPPRAVDGPGQTASHGGTMILKGTRLPPIPLVCLPPALLSVLSSSSSTRGLPARWPMISARSLPCPPAAPPRLSPVTESVFTRGTCAPRQRPIRRSPAHSAALPSCQNSIRRGGDDDSAASYPSQRRGARWSSSSAVSSSGFCDCRCSRSSIF